MPRGPFSLGRYSIGGPQLTIVGGPCLAESYEVCSSVARELARICIELDFQYIFKASFDKANRTSANSQRGMGIDAGLDLIKRVADEVGAPCTTDVHLPEQAGIVAQRIDLLQIPAFLCRQSDLLQACAETGKPVNVKKGQFLAPWDAKNIVEKLEAFGASGMMLTERGTSFGYNTLVVDMPGLETMRSFGVPVCFDATHSAQRPGGAGSSSGGNRETIPAMTRAAVAVGVDALFLEVHPDPTNALSDKETQWPLADAERLLRMVSEIHKATKEVSAR
ncbi:MAG: 3-deoxy-8-phosphooctulonate synthase [Fimbriimonadaceae bacterium]|nr:3-deoxy-8-phosphooctulonate synthase [Fimbriimonadaceae bacterium]